jgi:Protein of unknown function (DUF726)
LWLTTAHAIYIVGTHYCYYRCDRAEAAGKLLADVLLQREQGLRPVTLIGSSLGGRLIFSCLEEMTRRHTLWQQQQQQQQQQAGGSSASSGSSSGFMSKAKGLWSTSDASSGSSSDKNSDACCAAGIIENVVLLGAPVTTR